MRPEKIWRFVAPTFTGAELVKDPYKEDRVVISFNRRGEGWRGLSISRAEVIKLRDSLNTYLEG